MSSTRAAGKWRDKASQPSSTSTGEKPSYDLRNNKGKTLPELFNSPANAKRALSSPEKDEQRKVFLLDQRGQPIDPDQRGLPIGPDQGDQPSNDPPKAGHETNNSTQTDNPSIPAVASKSVNMLNYRHDATIKLGELIVELKRLSEASPTTDPALKAVIDLVYATGGTAGIYPASITLDLIKRAKESALVDMTTEACAMKWPEHAYEITNTIGEDDIELQGNTLVVIAKRGQSLIGQSTFLDKVPGLGKVHDKSPKITTIVQTETIDGIEDSTTSTHIASLEEEGGVEAFFNILCELKEKLKTSPGRIHIKTTTGHPIAMRKVYEIVFSDIKRSSSIIINSKTKRAHQPTESVIVSPGEMTYADLLKNIRDNVNGEDLGVRILNARKNNEGQLVMKVKGPTNALTNTLKKAIPGATTTIRAVMTTMHIRDLEEEVTDNDIELGIKKALPPDMTQKIVVKSIRPAYNSTSRATVQVPPDAARLLEKRGHIQVGLISARIRIRTENQRCPRCWKDGHSYRECKGEDMRNRCFRCHQEGHQKADCKEMAQREQK